MTPDTWEQRTKSDADRFQLGAPMGGIIISTTTSIMYEGKEEKERTTA